MKVRCNFCDNMIDETAEQCEFCGAPNERLTRVGKGVPKTIEELQEWYKAHNLPAYETTRFFIGIDYKGARAFGIYKKEDGDVVVYKNKGDGTRAVRYEGSDETYAVNEIYTKLKQEISAQKSGQTKSRPTTRKKRGIPITVIIVIAIILIGVAVSMIDSCGNGYYYYGGNNYYNHSGTWYIYDGYGDWYETDVPSELSDNMRDYYQDSDGDQFDGVKIENSEASSSWSSDDWDSDSSWDSGSSWDSSFSSSGWDSDW